MSKCCSLQLCMGTFVIDHTQQCQGFGKSPSCKTVLGLRQGPAARLRLTSRPHIIMLTRCSTLPVLQACTQNMPAGLSRQPGCLQANTQIHVRSHAAVDRGLHRRGQVMACGAEANEGIPSGERGAPPRVQRGKLQTVQLRIASSSGSAQPAPACQGCGWGVAVPAEASGCLPW